MNEITAKQTDQRKAELVKSLRAMREKICAVDLDAGRKLLSEYDKIEAQLKLYPDWDLIALQHHYK